jgi:hypothetical protein
MKLINKNIIIMLSLIFFFSGCSNIAYDLEKIVSNVTITKVEDSIDVYVQDQHTEIIDLKLARDLDNLTLLENTTIDQQYIIVNIPVVTPTTQHYICLKDKNGVAFYQGRIISIINLGSGNYNLSLDSPLDFPYIAGDGCALQSTNLAVDGSITPVKFSISPCNLLNGTGWDVTRLILLFGGTGVTVFDPAPDDSDFGVTTALTKGLVLRSVNGVTKNIFNVKTNGDLRARAYDVFYTTASKSRVYTVTTRRSFAGQEKNGVTIRLNADTCDKLVIIIQDDLTNMIGGQAIIQGHVSD